jgi:hypothetical protein
MQLNIPLCAQNDQSAIAPCVETIRGEPIDPNVAGAAVTSQSQVAKIFQFGELGMVVVGHLRGHDFGSGRAGEVEKLIDLMGGNIGQDAAVLGPAETNRAGSRA